MGGISKLNPCYQKANGRLQRLHALCFVALTAALTAVSTSAQDVKGRMAAALSGFAGQSIAVETVRTSPAPGIVEVQIENGPKIIGIGALEDRVAVHASQMFSANIFNFVEHFWDEEQKTINCDLDDEILGGCVITHGGSIVHERFKKS